MQIAVSLFPVVIFLLVLNSLDTFKLLKPSTIALAMLWGFISALVAYVINNFFFSILNPHLVSGLTAPIAEETLKFTIVALMFYKNKLGFLSDALIIGFAAGAGFSIIENIFYLNQIGPQSLMLWIIRGFGTAIMHGSSTAIAAVVAQTLISKAEKIKFVYLLAGLSSAVVVHAAFNSFLFSPLIQTVLEISLLPVIAVKIFTHSEKLLRNWMDEQYDSEFELLRLIRKGEFKTTRAGKYILSIKEKFAPEVILDMLAYIQLHLELSMKAKGLLMMKETGFDFKKEEELKAQLSELKYLSKNIGKTGMRTLIPVININNKDLWKLNLLK